MAPNPKRWFREYEEAREAARELAVWLRCDVGLARTYQDIKKATRAGVTWSPQGDGYRIFLLPRPQDRQGHELRCQVVTPESPQVLGPERAAVEELELP